MAMAFVLINSEMGLEEEVLTALKGIDSVVEANVVYGVYDLVAKVHGPSSEELKNTILTQIRSLENVRSTLTMIVIENQS
ncbi:MAG: Lrp/AsnC family transcriptional regulator [Candidatus Hodarchaeales archaeon]|jgi:DNA-binding Lrp family transcriptional regulator